MNYTLLTAISCCIVLLTSLMFYFTDHKLLTFILLILSIIVSLACTVVGIYTKETGGYIWMITLTLWIFNLIQFLTK